MASPESTEKTKSRSQQGSASLPREDMSGNGNDPDQLSPREKCTSDDGVPNQVSRNLKLSLIDF